LSSEGITQNVNFAPGYLRAHAPRAHPRQHAACAELISGPIASAVVAAQASGCCGADCWWHWKEQKQGCL